MKETQFRELLERYITGTISGPDQEELFGLLNKEEYLTVLKKVLDEEWNQGSYVEEENQQMANLVEQFVISKIRDEKDIAPVRQISFFRRYRMAAAAVLFLVLSGVAWLLMDKSTASNLANQPIEQRFQNDIVPAREQVSLTLGDGSQIVLDSASNGMVSLQGSTKVVKTDGTIAYVNGNSKEAVFNTISTGKGKVYHLVLSDGTAVWLDAVSSIRFPTAFPGSERVVEVTGQAYFEVARNEKQPFKVKSGGQMTEVLGTHFNINSYEQNIQTTLLEGSVRVTSASQESVILKPGQQSIVTGNRKPETGNNADLDEVMAWKNGRFYFNRSTVEEIMSQLSRWYDIEVVYQDKIRETFVVEVSKDMPVSKLLGLLEMTKQIKFTIEGNKVTVMNWK